LVYPVRRMILWTLGLKTDEGFLTCNLDDHLMEFKPKKRWQWGETNVFGREVLGESPIAKCNL
jgi:hypothetical protein